MSARDELAETITGYQIGEGYYSVSIGYSDAQAIADDILAVGFTKPTNEQKAAETALDQIRAAMDAMFRGEVAQIHTLARISEHIGAYEKERA